MTITEIALLRLAPGITLGDATLRSNLAHAEEVMQNYTGKTFHYLQQTEDPSCIYIVGEWESLDQHMKHFIPSDGNQALLVLLKDQLSVEWLLHADVSHADLPLPRSKSAIDKAIGGELIFSIARHMVKDGQKEEFQRTFVANRQYLQGFLTEGIMGGGWRIDKEEEGKEEWVLLCPYTSVQQHYDFAKTPEFERYGLIREHMDGAEIKHAKILDV
ncbi:hypothetical protein DE146DRAFT_38963 [Phaeosphaeria sp. MPI-PUGE-AT-0046c]|nr:hypothetical protein DE146DRAFT_38963 [Phaeosphaeria sp. MPI-PUGE-AT-0046c]